MIINVLPNTPIVRWNIFAFINALVPAQTLPINNLNTGAWNSYVNSKGLLLYLNLDGPDLTSNQNQLLSDSFEFFMAGNSPI